MLRSLIRHASTTSTITKTPTIKSRPSLLTILPSKRTINRILFDNDSSVTYSKMIPVLTEIYNNLSTPQQIKISSNITTRDLMIFKKVLENIRNLTQSINKNLVDLENEIIEQCAEMGDLDAITLLSFETIRNSLKPNTIITPQLKDDLKTANKFIKELTDLKHPLVFKMAGDLAYEKGVFNKAIEYYQQFLSVEQNTIESGHIYYNLGYYYLTQEPKDLEKAKEFFLKCIKLCDLDQYSIKAHYYLGQLYIDKNPKLAKYHMEISASKSLLESFTSLGFLEMNKFKNYNVAIEWFKLGIESQNKDVLCLIGCFDCYILLENWKEANKILNNLTELKNKMNVVNNKGKKSIPESMRGQFEMNESLLSNFFKGRTTELELLKSKTQV
ncbi:uncharacterized protein KGF55_002156 [Candida pseudojiufengensis]|uniref:uncharacterized protein n=1 Tax=Candida pseudojiufengensis TaxID=497109 RepID=UPI0022254B14|nr:uncharacterized protein KGF55_002156 [Candida pseudojiufengensis]KAI5964214.1 hypothetical protein KGF55_002156 [Candida pseudojiufengensis]